MESFIQNNWQILTGVAAVVIWLIRLEGKVLSSEKRLDTLEDQHAIIEQMALDIREVKTDMKWLKQNTSV